MQATSAEKPRIISSGRFEFSTVVNWRLRYRQLGARSVTVLKRLVTISVPVLNEADNIEPLMARLRAVAETHHAYDFEFLFTDNASTDATFERLPNQARADNSARVIRVTPNFRL